MVRRVCGLRCVRWAATPRDGVPPFGAAGHGCGCGCGVAAEKIRVIPRRRSVLHISIVRCARVADPGHDVRGEKRPWQQEQLAVPSPQDPVRSHGSHVVVVVVVPSAGCHF
uniref:Uncharacterized protein n=1 Tax=Physcomitrium patens TaxID=3218 RepID=A9SDM8_PHYPA|nr:hypothetical protein PHYPA_022499 [Physcomitrium patens]